MESIIRCKKCRTLLKYKADSHKIEDVTCSLCGDTQSYELCPNCKKSFLVSDVACHDVATCGLADNFDALYSQNRGCYEKRDMSFDNKVLLSANRTVYQEVMAVKRVVTSSDPKVLRRIEGLEKKLDQVIQMLTFLPPVCGTEYKLSQQSYEDGKQRQK